MHNVNGAHSADPAQECAQTHTVRGVEQFIEILGPSESALTAVPPALDAALSSATGPRARTFGA